MDTPVVAAVITSLVSLITALWTAVWTSRQNAATRSLQRQLAETQRSAQLDVEQLKRRLDQEKIEEQRRFDAREKLDLYRLPLLDAARALRNRIDNILNSNFLLYFEAGENRERTALLSTFYRFARYFAVVEIIYEGANLLRFEQAEETKPVADVLANVGRTLASEEFDRSNGFATARFMLWIEEQRAIGELCIERGRSGDPQPVGFATFSKDFDERFSRWFANLQVDLRSEGAVQSQRLAALQALLTELVRQLDREGRFR